MTTRRLVWLAAWSIALVLALSTGAAAETMKLTGLATGWQNYYGEATGPYVVSVNGVATNLICDDGGTNISMGQTWTATQYAFNSANAQNFKFWGTGGALIDKNGASRSFTVSGQTISDAATAYTMAAWLALKIFQDPTNANGQWGALNWAIWSIFNAQTPSDAAANDWLAKAYAAVTSGNLTLNSTMFSGLRIFVPDPLSASQEFIGYVPEPATMILLGTGLFGVGFGRKKLAKVRG